MTADAWIAVRCHETARSRRQGDDLGEAGGGGRP